jgi:hypothetical protein
VTPRKPIGRPRLGKQRVVRTTISLPGEVMTMAVRQKAKRFESMSALVMRLVLEQEARERAGKETP